MRRFFHGDRQASSGQSNSPDSPRVKVEYGEIWQTNW